MSMLNSTLISQLKELVFLIRSYALLRVLLDLLGLALTGWALVLFAGSVPSRSILELIVLIALGLVLSYTFALLVTKVSYTFLQITFVLQCLAIFSVVTAYPFTVLIMRFGQLVQSIVPS